MDIVFVGAGRLATNMAQALCQKGHRIVAIYSRTMLSAQQLAEKVGAEATCDLQSLPKNADAFIFSVKDTVLGSLIADLQSGREEVPFFHTAGSVSMEVFGQHRHHGIIYPMQTFSKERLVDFSRVPIFIEANDDSSLRLAEDLASSISPLIYHLSSAERRYLHLAAVFACNFANHCYALSAEILQKHGLPFSVMLPLINETAQKVNTMNPVEAQTGPAVRYDVNVIEAQNALLADAPDVQKIYELMSKSIHLLAK
ncbi:Rossmann-like and DUF2520 domain-containing protein [Xylanibacter brevis]|uniref:Rossmann-like and DUF2520 domain-containing protein n=1 Tax=Xylanibacter brevis TaxID=83231 RepID=UPI0004809A25|nr:Rossmann-like and DUF2520 domain-containing protein [Xylanibacter brevis]